MPSLAARSQLQKHSSDVYVQDILERGFAMTVPDPKNRDQISVFLTQAPNEPTVWMIQRAQTFDPGLLPSPDRRFMSCSGNGFITNISHGPDRTNDILALCYGSFLGITHYVNMRDAQLVRTYTLELVNLPYAVGAATITMTANKTAAEKARQAELNKANQNKPVF